jgi:N-acetylneuraminic acid mutarotase
MIARTLLFFIFIVVSARGAEGEWRQLPSLPDSEGFAGMYAGVSHGALIVAGGANFPRKKPWEGGTKVWYDTVYVLEKPTARWKVAGKLPRPLGYGVSVTHSNAVICVGGSDHDRHYANVFRLEWSGGKLKTTQLASLPGPLANCSGAMVNDVLYVAGGIEKPTATEALKRVWRFDFGAKAPRWTEVSMWPGSGRMLAVAAGSKDTFWLIGGVDLSVGKDDAPKRRYLADAYCYDPASGWNRLPDLPHSVVAAPSPAPATGKSIYLLGGDDGTQIDTPPNRHAGFTRTALTFDIAKETWTTADAVKAPRAAIPCAYWENSWVMPSGEMRPGVRSPEVWSWTPKTTD